MEKKVVGCYLKYFKYLFQEKGDMLKKKGAFMVQTYSYVQLHWHLSSSAVLLKLSVAQWIPQQNILPGRKTEHIGGANGNDANNVWGKSAFDFSVCHNMWLVNTKQEETPVCPDGICRSQNFLNLVHRLQAKVTGFVEKPKHDLFREISKLKIYYINNKSNKNKLINKE